MLIHPYLTVLVRMFECLLYTVTSTGRCNTCVKPFCWCDDVSL